MMFHSVVKIPLLALCSALSLLSIHCGSKIAGSEVANEKTVVYMPGGKTRAAMATVQIIPVDHLPEKTTGLYFTDTTDSAGEYMATGIPDGCYNVVARKDSFISLLDSVYIKNSGGIPDDTLEIPGSLSARVKLQPNHKPRAVFVQLIGTLEHYYSNVDSTGLFTIENVADGTYLLRLETTQYPEYTPTFKTIRIRSGVHDTLEEPIELIYNGIPVVTNLQASYNSQSGVIAISWEPVNYSDSYDYAVFRDHVDSMELSSVPYAYVTKPEFFDTIKSSASGSPSVLRYMYRVAVRNSSLQKGETFKFVTAAALTGNKKGLLFSSDTLNFKAGIPCTLSIKPNPLLGTIAAYYYCIGNTSPFVEISGPDTSFVLSIAGDSITRDFPCIAKVITSDGIELTDTLYLQSQLTWKKIAESPAVNNLQYYSVSFKGSIILFVSDVSSTDTVTWNCWSSIDGITWKIISDSLPFTVQNKILVFKNKLWAIDRSSGLSANIWSSEDGLNWTAESINTISNNLYSTRYEIWTTWRERLILVNYYPLCLENNSCVGQVANCWESSDGSQWNSFDLNKSLFPDRYDKPNTNFTACDLNGGLFIGGAWRALGLKNPPWTAYSFRVWNQTSDDPLQISFPVPVDTNASFDDLKVETVLMKGNLFLTSSADPDFMWTLLENKHWVRCSDSYPGGENGYQTCVTHNEALFSISNKGVWTILK